jgi:hypothetical protein
MTQGGEHVRSTDESDDRVRIPQDFERLVEARLASLPPELSQLQTDRRACKRHVQQERVWLAPCTRIMEAVSYGRYRF